MHVDITQDLKQFIVRKHIKKDEKSLENEQAKLKQSTQFKSSTHKPQAVPISAPTNNKKLQAISFSPPSNKPQPVNDNAPSSQHTKTTIAEKAMKLQFELENNDEYNISHISITAVIRKSTNEVRKESSILLIFDD